MPDSEARGLPRNAPDLILDMDEQGFGYTVGISFPPYPALYDVCFRTDIRGGMLFRWNGTYWLSEQQFVVTGPAASFAVSDQSRLLGCPSDVDLYLLRMDMQYSPLGTNNGSNYWTVALKTWDFTTITTVAGTTFNTSAITGWQDVHQSLAHLVDSRSGSPTEKTVYLEFTTTGAPGALLFVPALTYRLRAT